MSYEQLPLARSTDPDTSHAAARRLTRADSMRAKLLRTYCQHGGLTAEEASEFAGYGPADGAWKRVSDLRNLGYLCDSGLRRVGTSGRQQVVLQATPAGRAAYLEGPK